MGIFIHHPDGYIIINGERFEMDVFLAVEPGYSLPSPATHRSYEQGKRHILSNGKDAWSSEYPWVQGDIYISRVTDFILMRLADEQDTLDAEEAVTQAQFDQLSPTEQRKQKFPQVPEMIEALWRHVVEGEDLNKSGCKEIQSRRNAVRNQYPDA